MSLNLPYKDTCPRCRKLTMQSVIEAHPRRKDVALQNFRCVDCGPAKTIVLSLEPVKKPSPHLAA
jgi:transposase-like protein